MLTLNFKLWSLNTDNAQPLKTKLFSNMSAKIRKPIGLTIFVGFSGDIDTC